jgi:hypothetical protein
MTEEKIINWRAMDSRQRDQLMVEKVLGYSLELVQDSIDKIPRYSTSLDAAWLLWPKLAEGDDGKAFVRQCKFMCAWTEDDDVEHYDWRTYNAYRPFLEIGDMSSVTSERICIAMLRAFDYTVLTEEVSQ